MLHQLRGGPAGRGTIRIGGDVQVGPNVQFLTLTHPVEPEARRAKWEAARPISVADNVWLGGGVIICPGVIVGENIVVGAGAVVVRDLPANVVAVGNPALVIRSLWLPAQFRPVNRGGRVGSTRTGPPRRLLDASVLEHDQASEQRQRQRQQRQLGRGSHRAPRGY